MATRVRSRSSPRCTRRSSDSGSWIAPTIGIAAIRHVPRFALWSDAVTARSTGNPLVDCLLAEPLAVHDGQLRLGNAPGLGVELDEQVIERYRMPDPLVLPDGFYSDMVFGKESLYSPPPYQESTR